MYNRELNSNYHDGALFLNGMVVKPQDIRSHYHKHLETFLQLA